MKDLFSQNSSLYQQRRPSYPSDFVSEILKYVPTRHFAWDCGAGSGQLTLLLAPYFEQLVATDISRAQLQNAPYLDNVSYQVQSAEHTDFAAQSFDLITVAQAIHWFDFKDFYQEVKRTLKPDGVLAVLGYGTLTVSDPQLNQRIQHLYTQTLAGHWEPERAHIDAHYQSIPFPFELVAEHNSQMQYQWTAAQLLGYLNTWSAIAHYRAQYPDQEPLAEIQAYFAEDDQVKIELQFPLFLRIGRVA